jgi:hypothetical protein
VGKLSKIFDALGNPIVNFASTAVDKGANMVGGGGSAPSLGPYFDSARDTANTFGLPGVAGVIDETHNAARRLGISSTSVEQHNVEPAGPDMRLTSADVPATGRAVMRAVDASYVPPPPAANDKTGKKPSGMAYTMGGGMGNSVDAAAAPSIT